MVSPWNTHASPTITMRYTFNGVLSVVCPLYMESQCLKNEQKCRVGALLFVGKNHFILHRTSKTGQ